MRWEDMRQSENVEERGGMRPGGGGFPFGGGMRLGGGGLIVLLVLAFVFGINPLDMLSGGGPAPAPQTAPPGYGPQSAPRPGGPATQAQSIERRIVGAVLGDTEDVWTSLFRALGRGAYENPRLVIFSGGVDSKCGIASTAVGPFYCPADKKLYLDTAFFDELARRFGAPGDFAMAYVVAHEVGHHVQNLFGTMEQVEGAGVRGGGRGANSLAVRLELQADCYAGVWGYFAKQRNLLEPGDLEEGLRAAAAVGDDEIQQRSRGHVRPDAFTHGSSEQRMRWFRRGLESGDPRRCDTFSVAQP